MADSRTEDTSMEQTGAAAAAAGVPVPRTILLYDDMPYGTEFTARVLNVRPADEQQWEVILDRTLFFPEEGGQEPDCGTLGGYMVTDVQIRDGVICHTVGPAQGGTQPPFEAGDEVGGRIDWAFRFSNMQNHTGEHILSGLLHSQYGADNIGFRLSRSTVTVDTSVRLDPEALARLERDANEVIWRNVPVTARYPEPEELARTAYRSKKEIDGPVRIVTVEGVDVCACCAPHVAHTGEIGALRIVGAENMGGGMRLSILCGARALEYDAQLRGELSQISRLTSRPLTGCAEGVSRLLEENASLRYAMHGLEEEIVALRADAVPADRQQVMLFVPPMAAAAQRELVNRLCAARTGACGVFAGSDSEGWRFIIGHGSASSGGDARPWAAALRESLGARGGGSKEMVQGQVTAPRSEVLAVFGRALCYTE